MCVDGVLAVVSGGFLPFVASWGDSFEPPAAVLEAGFTFFGTMGEAEDWDFTGVAGTFEVVRVAAVSGEDTEDTVKYTLLL